MRAEPVVEAPPHDLGFGSALSQGRQGRLLRRDGTFTTKRVGLSAVESFGLYHYLLTTTWPRFLGLVAVAFVAVNALFALLYVALGPEALKGGVATTLGGRIQEAFFFSVHTLATIGYGNIVPASIAANVLDALEALIGLLGVAIVAGIGFARVSRPVAGIKFSDVAVVAPYRGGTGLMFRLANVRRHELIQVKVDVSISLLRADGTRAFHSLDLERTEVVFVPTSWTVVHPIGKTSPLYGIDRDTFATCRPEIFVLLTATEEVFSQVVHARFSYADAEIRWGARFSPILEYHKGGLIGSVDVGRLSEIEPAPLPV